MMTAPGQPPKDKRLVWALAAGGGCLALVVVLLIVGVVVWLATRPDDEINYDLEFPSATIDTTGWFEEGPVDGGAPSGTYVEMRTLTGRVVDGDTGMPLEGAMVTLVGPSTVPLITYTDPSGIYSVNLDEVGPYMLTVSAAAHLTGIYPNAFELSVDTPSVAELEDIALQAD